jgi:hypothetical protein
MLKKILPIPDVSALTTPTQNMVATAASTALPPCSRIARPILEHSVLSPVYGINTLPSR